METHIYNVYIEESTYTGHSMTVRAHSEDEARRFAEEFYNRKDKHIIRSVDKLDDTLGVIHVDLIDG